MTLDAASAATVALIKAICGNNHPKFYQALADNADINGCNGRGMTPLMWAAGTSSTFSDEHTRIVLLDKLIELGALLDLQNDNGASALHYACATGKLDRVASLLYAGADSTLRNGNGALAEDNASENILNLFRDYRIAKEQQALHKCADAPPEPPESTKVRKSI